MREQKKKKNHKRGSHFSVRDVKTGSVFRGLKMLFAKKKGSFFKSWGSENVQFQEKGVVFVKADLKF